MIRCRNLVIVISIMCCLILSSSMGARAVPPLPDTCPWDEPVTPSLLEYIDTMTETDAVMECDTVHLSQGRLRVDIYTATSLAWQTPAPKYYEICRRTDALCYLFENDEEGDSTFIARALFETTSDRVSCYGEARKLCGQLME